MYYYVYDEFVQDPKFERELSLMETRLTDLGIAGKIARLALFRDPRELIRDEIRKGIKTIIAVGNDATLKTVIDASIDKDVVVGIIPFGKEKNEMANMLGIPFGVQACDVLSARIVEELDLGSVNGNRFLHSAMLEGGVDLQIECDGKFIIKSFRRCWVEIRNLASQRDDVGQANPVDGKLEVVIRVPERKFFGKKKNTTSIIPVERLQIISKEVISMVIDGEKSEGMNFECLVLPKQIRIITGKGRNF